MAQKVPLPFGTDVTHFVISQGFGGLASHHGDLNYPLWYSYDFAVPLHTWVRAQANGLVIAVNDDHADNQTDRTTRGNYVTIQYSSGFYATYQHLMKGALVRVGDLVIPGMAIGWVGLTGDTDGYHLHVTYGLKTTSWGTTAAAPIAADGSQAANDYIDPVRFATPDGELVVNYPLNPKGVFYDGDPAQNMLNAVYENSTNNLIVGTPGNDTLVSGKKADIFVLTGGDDAIVGFNPAKGDRIQLPYGTTLSMLFLKSYGNADSEVLVHPGGTLALVRPNALGAEGSFPDSWFVNVGPGPDKPPEITGHQTFKEAGLVYFQLNFTDLESDVVGFGFRGINGTETHSFQDPSFGRVSPGQIEYPFNLGTGVLPQPLKTDIYAWVFDAAQNRSPEVLFHLAG